MFELFSPSHLLIIAIAIIVFVGPKDLPRFMRAAGKWSRKVRGFVDEFRGSFDEMSRHEELKELREELAALRSKRPEDFQPASPAAIHAEPAAAAPELATQP